MNRADLNINTTETNMNLLSEQVEIEEVLNNKVPKPLLENGRQNVEVSLSFKGCIGLASGDLRIQVVLKFRYHQDVLKLVPLPLGETPESIIQNKKLPYVHKEYGERCLKYIPWHLESAVDETPRSWCFTMKKEAESPTDLNCYERMVIDTTIAITAFTYLYPFMLDVICVRIILDGTGESEKINLIAKREKNTGKPDLDYSIFSKQTSRYCIDDEKKDISLITMVRDQNVGGTKGLFTRVYATMIFTNGTVGWLQAFTKYCIVSTVMMYFIPLSLHDEEISLEGLIQIGITIILTTSALLFTVPRNYDFNTVEQILIMHMIIPVVIMMILSGRVIKANNKSDVLIEDRDYVLSAVICVSVFTILWVDRAFLVFTKFVNKVREAIAPPPHVDVVGYSRIEDLL